MESSTTANPAHVVRIRGIPFKTTPQDIAHFLGDIALVHGMDSIVMAKLPDGRPTGDAFVQLASATARDAALARHGEKLGSKYVQIFAATEQDFVTAGGSGTSESLSDPLPVSSLPFSLHGSLSSQGLAGGTPTETPMDPVCMSDSISSSVSMPLLQQLSLDGPGLVQEGPMGSVGPSSAPPKPPMHTTAVIRSPRPPPQPAYLMPQDGPVVELRGLPYSATVDDIINFFQGFKLSRDAIKLPSRKDERTGGAVNTGYATVTFQSTEEAAKARQLKHCAAMGSRYIECLPPSYRSGRRVRDELPDDKHWRSNDYGAGRPGVLNLSRGGSAPLPGYIQAVPGPMPAYVGSPMQVCKQHAGYMFGNPMQGYVLVSGSPMVPAGPPMMPAGQQLVAGPSGYAMAGPGGYAYPATYMPVRPGMSYIPIPPSTSPPSAVFFSPPAYPHGPLTQLTQPAGHTGTNPALETVPASPVANMYSSPGTAYFAPYVDMVQPGVRGTSQGPRSQVADGPGPALGTHRPPVQGNPGPVVWPETGFTWSHTGSLESQHQSRGRGASKRPQPLSIPLPSSLVAPPSTSQAPLTLNPASSSPFASESLSELLAPRLSGGPKATPTIHKDPQRAKGPSPPAATLTGTSAALRAPTP